MEDLIQLISKMDVVKDPGDQINDLEDIFNSRKLLLTMLLKVNQI
jgi:hypothetical protein